MITFTIREPTSADIPALAALHFQAWNETYPGVRSRPTLEIRQRPNLRSVTMVLWSNHETGNQR